MDGWMVEERSGSWWSTEVLVDGGWVDGCFISVRGLDWLVACTVARGSSIMYGAAFLLDI